MFFPHTFEFPWNSPYTALCFSWRTQDDMNPQEKLHQLESPQRVHPALHTTATWKLWPSCVLANLALALGSLGKEQPSFCQSAVFPCREQWSYFSFEFPLNRSYCPYIWFVRQLGRLGFSPHTSPIFRLDCWLWYTRLICSCKSCHLYC